MPANDPAKPDNAIPEASKEPAKTDPPAKTLKSAVLRVIGDGKHLPGVIMATAALVTAITSMVKAVDTSVERASYNALSKEIRGMKTDQKALWEVVQTLSSAKPTVTLVTPPTPSAAATTAATAPSARPPRIGALALMARPTASAVATPSATPVMVVVEPPRPPMPPRMVRVETPSFDQVQAAAAAE
jgi:type II secretory pathway pseudopilin PulG